MALQFSIRAADLLALGKRFAWRLQSLGLQGQLSQRDQQQIVILNTITLLAILPVKVVLGCIYGLAGLWPETLLMAAAFGVVTAFVIGHSQGKIGLNAYGQCTLIASFCCPFILTFLLGGYHNSALVMLWSLLTPALALLLKRPQMARRWLGLFFVFNLLVIGIEGSQQTNDSLEDIEIGLLAFNGIGAGILTYGCLNYLHQQHQQAIEQLDQFASLVAHELRSPLTSISFGISHSLRQQERLSASQLLALETAQAETQRSQTMLQDLLQISRAPAGQSDLIRQRLDPYPLLLSLANQAQQHLGVSIQVHCPLSVGERRLWATPNPFNQMVWNLLENSAKYADRSQPIELAITPDLNGDQLQIQVADRGSQLSSQQCQAIFSPFYRLAGAREQTGSGLGLTLVRRFAEAMGGSVSASAREGGGLIVSLSLPKAGRAPSPKQRIHQPLGLNSNGPQASRGGGGGIFSNRRLIRTHPE